MPDALSYGIQDMSGSLEESRGRRFPVDGVYHHLPWADSLQGFQIGNQIFLARIVHTCSLCLSTHEHGLYDTVSLEVGHRSHLFLHVIMSLWPVHSADVIRIHGIQLEYIVVEEHECLPYLSPVNLCGIAQNTHSGRGTAFIPHLFHSLYYLGEHGMECGFSISGKREHIGSDALLLHLSQFLSQCAFHFGECGQGVVGAVVTVVGAGCAAGVSRKAQLMAMTATGSAMQQMLTSHRVREEDFFCVFFFALYFPMMILLWKW